ncbi:MAG: RpiB/LacA/LacB family sugar-phosphate isomerase, partial [Candidatus Nomurabacteria bacterium]
DFGAYQYDANDDYPKFISVCAGALSADIYTGLKNNLAFVFGGSGEGEAIVADKYKGVRAGVVNSENIELVKLLREHNNANILSFGARFISEDFAKKAAKTFIVTRFLETEDGKETRHERRIEEIDELENEVDLKINAEELNELKLFEEMKKERDDN